MALPVGYCVARSLPGHISKEYRSTPPCVTDVDDRLDRLPRGSPVRPARKNTLVPHICQGTPDDMDLAAQWTTVGR
jgi:hypothetical protein